jgi:hypothetical protein
VAEPLELFRLKCVIDRRTIRNQLNALQTEQSFGLSGLRPIQPRFSRIEAGSSRTKARSHHRIAHQLLILQPYIHYYKRVSKIGKLIHNHVQLTSITACPTHSGRKSFMRLQTSRRQTPSLARGLVSLRRVSAGRGRVPLHGPAKRNGRRPPKVVRGVLVGNT